jgi:hypothetical protein
MQKMEDQVVLEVVLRPAVLGPLPQEQSALELLIKVSQAV